MRVSYGKQRFVETEDTFDHFKYKFVIFITLLILLIGWPIKVQAASEKYITTEEFIKKVVEELSLSVDSYTNQSYIDAARKAGILPDRTIQNYKAVLTKMDAAVILVGADKYLNDSKVSNQLLDEIIDRRISDINGISDEKKVWLSKAYALGFLKGDSSGDYSTSRCLKPSERIKIKDAEKLIHMLRNQKLRNKISPDGQLIRTKTLPVLAKEYPYILASFPNEYYDWNFSYMDTIVYRSLNPEDPNQMTGISIYDSKEFVDGTDYASPSKFKIFKNKDKFFRVGEKMLNTQELLDQGWRKWEENVTNYLYAAFNVDYRTMENNQKWKDILISTDSSYKTENQSWLEEELEKYITAAVRNRTIVECDKIAFDKSTIYYSGNEILLRVYVHYRVISSKWNGEFNRERLNPIIFTTNNFAMYQSLKLGEWRNGYFEIVLDNSERFGIYKGRVDDTYHTTSRVTGERDNAS